MELKIPGLNSSTTKWIWYAVLIMLNTNAMFERVSFSPILREMGDVLCEGGCSQSQMGFISTFYYIVAILSSPIGGFLGDRISKKYLLIAALCFWSGFVLLMTFMTSYWPFVIVNGLSCAGVRLFSNMSATIIAGLFDKESLAMLYGFYFLSVPVGIGLGMIVPESVAEATGDWRTSLRITPGITLFCASIIFFLLNDPPKGAGGRKEEEKENPASFWSDLKYLISIKSYILLVVGLTCRSFLSTILSYFGPSLFQVAARHYEDEGSLPFPVEKVARILGIFMIVGGVLGLGIGQVSNYYLGAKFYKYAPLLIGISSLLAVPTICGSLLLADQNIIAAMVLYASFICILYAFQAWVQKISMGIILPSKRVLGNSLLTMVNTIFGSASSPFIFGSIVDWINPTGAEDKELEAKRLTFILGYVIFGIGGICWILMMFFFNKDTEAVDKALQIDSIKETVDIEAQKHPDVGNITQKEKEETIEGNEADKKSGRHGINRD